MALRYDGPPYPYTDHVRIGIANVRGAIEDVWGVRTEVVRDESRCREQASEHCAARAIDAYSDKRSIRRAIFDACVARADQLCVQSVIADRRVWGFGHWFERAYTGEHPHDDHVHIGFNRDAATTLTREYARGLLLGAPLPDRKDLSMYSPDELRAILWDAPVRNLMHSSEVKPAHVILGWAHRDANAAMHAAEVAIARLQNVEDRLAAIEERLSS